MDRNALVVNGLTKRYQDFTLDGVSFTVPQGSIVGLIGENGAGKSTTLHAVLGLIGRDGGTVELLGLPDTALDDGVRNQIGVVFDGNSYPEMLTPRKLGRVMGKIYRTWDPDPYAALLQQLALPADKRIKALSKGMKMKLSLAAAFAARGLEAQVTQIWAARSKGAGGLNLMMGQNPVWLISGRRREEEA